MTLTKIEVKTGLKWGYSDEGPPFYSSLLMAYILF